MAQDNDGKRHLRIVSAQSAPARTANAAAAARYRARQRGEHAAKRKPGPKPKHTTELRLQIRDLKNRIGQLETFKRILDERLARTYRGVPVTGIADELLAVLRTHPPETDSPEERVILGDLIAAIEARHEYWPE
jgi:hypothetical protein